MQWTDDSFNYFFSLQKLMTAVAVYSCQSVQWHDYANRALRCAYTVCLFVSLSMLLVSAGL